MSETIPEFANAEDEVDYLKGYLVSANEKIEQLEKENAELREDISRHLILIEFLEVVSSTKKELYKKIHAEQQATIKLLAEKLKEAAEEHQECIEGVCFYTEDGKKYRSLADEYL